MCFIQVEECVDRISSSKRAMGTQSRDTQPGAAAPTCPTPLFCRWENSLGVAPLAWVGQPVRAETVWNGAVPGKSQHCPQQGSHREHHSAPYCLLVERLLSFCINEEILLKWYT